MLFLTKKRKEKIVNNLYNQFIIIFRDKGINLKQKDTFKMYNLLSESFDIKKEKKNIFSKLLKKWKM